MKRPHSISFLVSSSIICSSATPTSATVFDTEIIDPRKKDDTYKLEPCFTLLTHATKYDFDSSGGLSKSEFASYYKSLDGSSSSFSTSNVDTTVDWLTDTSNKLYNELLCECHHTYGYPISCCDDTNTADDDGVEIEIAGGKNTPGSQDNSGTWNEVSLLGISDAAQGDKPGGKEKEYIKIFCNGIENAMEEEDIELGIDQDEPVTAPATTVAATEAAATNGTDAPPTTTVDPETTFVPTLGTGTPDIIDSTTTTTTTAISTAETAVTTVATDATQTQEPIVLSFVGSTGGSANATTVNMDDVTNAVWKVSLDILNELQISSRRLSVVEGVSLMHIRHNDGVDEKEHANGSDEEMEMEKRGRQLDSWDFGEEAALYFESVVMDVEDVECPDGLDYAAPSDQCIEFTYTLLPLPNGPLTPELAAEFTASFDSAVNDDGKLYDALVSEYQDTDIVGLGSPGKGIPLDDSEANAAQIEMDQLERNSANQTDVQSSGLSVGGIVGIVMAAVLVSLLIAAAIVKKRRRSKQSLDDSNLSEDIEADEVNADAAHVEEWLDEEDESGNGRNRTRDGMKSPGSSLAALGVASTVATRLSTGDTEVMFTQKQAWSKDQPVV